MNEPAIKDVILATTTSTQDSGLLTLIPIFEKDTGYKVKTIAVEPDKLWLWGNVVKRTFYWYTRLTAKNPWLNRVSVSTASW